MSLIVCPECQNKISEYAETCIHCGCPMEKIKELINDKVAKIEINVNKKPAQIIEESNNTYYDRMTLSAWLEEGMLLYIRENGSKLCYYSDDEIDDIVYDLDMETEEQLYNYCCKENRKILKKYGFKNSEIDILLEELKRGWL